MPVVAFNVVNAPVDTVVAPIDVPSIVPPVIATVPAFCVDMVPKPVIAVLGIVVDADTALVPLPNRYPDNVVAPVPPLATFNVPASVIVPDTVTGPPDVVSPVVPPDTSTLVTVPPAEGVAEIVMPPEEFEMLTFVPAVKVANE